VTQHPRLNGAASGSGTRQRPIATRPPTTSATSSGRARLHAVTCSFLARACSARPSGRSASSPRRAQASRSSRAPYRCSAPGASTPSRPASTSSRTTSSRTTTGTSRPASELARARGGGSLEHVRELERGFSPRSVSPLTCSDEWAGRRAYADVTMDDGAVVKCSREIAVIYYLTRDWQASYGGALLDIPTATRYVPEVPPPLRLSENGHLPRLFRPLPPPPTPSCQAPRLARPRPCTPAPLPHLARPPTPPRRAQFNSLIAFNIPRFHEVEPVRAPRPRERPPLLVSLRSLPSGIRLGAWPRARRPGASARTRHEQGTQSSGGSSSLASATSSGQTRQRPKPARGALRRARLPRARARARRCGRGARQRTGARRRSRRSSGGPGSRRVARASGAGARPPQPFSARSGICLWNTQALPRPPSPPPRPPRPMHPGH
jgi:hypothetical protein